MRSTFHRSCAPSVCIPHSLRSGFAPEQGDNEEDDEEDEELEDSPSNVNGEAVVEDPGSPLRANPVYQA